MVSCLASNVPFANTQFADMLSISRASRQDRGHLRAADCTVSGPMIAYLRTVVVSIYRCSVALVLVCSTGLVVDGRLSPFFGAANMPTTAAEAMRPVKLPVKDGVQVHDGQKHLP